MPIFFNYCKYSLVLLLILHCFAPVQAQNEHTSTAYQLEELPEDSRLNSKSARELEDQFDYRDEREKEEKKEEDTFEARQGPALSTEMREVLKYSLFGLIILVLSFVAFRLIAGGLNLNNKKIKLNDQVYSIDDIEDKLHEVDVEAFLQQALAQKDYRLAIRLYYLAILKELSLGGQIVWKKDKTNGVYLREMRQHPQITSFRKATYIYEYVWFNEDEPFEAKDYEQLRPLFNQMLQAASTHSTP